MTEGRVRAEWSGDRLSITLDRPAARNSVTPAMLEELEGAIAEARRARVVTIIGAGASFCAGADVRSYAEPAEQLDRLDAYTRRARDLCRAIETLDAVVIAGVRGSCFGGGLEIALACDLVVASTTARLGLPETRLGLIPGWGGTQRLTRSVGAARARRLILTAEALDGETAAAWGLVSFVSPDAELETELDRLAAQALTGAPLAFAAASRAIAAASAPSWPAPGDELETDELLRLFASQDGAEGVAAFLAKRPPEFSGR